MQAEFQKSERNFSSKEQIGYSNSTNNTNSYKSYLHKELKQSHDLSHTHKELKQSHDLSYTHKELKQSANLNQILV
jgi:hypothetical protein